MDPRRHRTGALLDMVEGRSKQAFKQRLAARPSTGETM